MQIKNDVVDVQWLHDHLDHPNLVLLDATIPKVAGKGKELPQKWIPNTIFFDIKNNFSLQDAPFPNTLPTAQQFEEEARKLGINSESLLVVYDREGMYSSPRAWYMFKAFGHDNVAVLNGGLPAWIKMGFTTTHHLDSSSTIGDFKSNYRPTYFVDLDYIEQSNNSAKNVILDARSSDRFQGKVAEPRKGLRSGTIPGSKNLPYQSILDNSHLKPKDEIKTLFDALTDKEDNIIMYCGSGITACVLALGASITGRKNIAVYDGSWTEYGSLIKS